MKIKATLCDVCGKDITDADKRYKFKKYTRDYYEDTQCKKMDMCISCYVKLIDFINEKNKNEKELLK